jgi:hypothetical protein
MRVMGTLVILLVVLLALCALAPAAGAIYIEGQTIPDDGMMHILSAEENMGENAPAGMPTDESLPLEIPANVLPAGLWEDAYAGETGLPAGFPSMLVDDTLPAMLPYEGLATMPEMTIPSAAEGYADGNIDENTGLPLTSGYWNFADLSNLQTNMPVLSDLFF